MSENQICLVFGHSKRVWFWNVHFSDICQKSRLKIQILDTSLDLKKTNEKTAQLIAKILTSICLDYGRLVFRYLLYKHPPCWQLNKYSTNRNQNPGLGHWGPLRQCRQKCCPGCRSPWWRSTQNPITIPDLKTRCKFHKSLSTHFGALWCQKYQFWSLKHQNLNTKKIAA